MTACICRRAPRGFAWHDMATPHMFRKPPVHCCSLTCLDIAVSRTGNMDINVDEARAIQQASPEIGSYLEQIGKTDLAAMTEDEWLGFLAHAFTKTCEAVRRQWTDESPF